eukprot:g7460.t1
MSNTSYHQPRIEIEPTKLLARTIYAHTGYVSSVAFFGPQCDRLITGSYDETAKLWDLKTGRSLQKFQGHTDGVTFAILGPDGRVLTASEDRTLRVWDVDTGDCLRVIRSHSGSVTSLCMAGPDRIITGSSDKKLRVFDIGGHLCGETELDSEILAVASPPLPVQRRRPSRGGGRGSRGNGGGGRKADGDQFLRTDSNSNTAPAVVRILACGGTYIPAPTKPMLCSVDVKTKPTSNAVVEDDVSGGRPEGSNLCTGRSEYDDDDERTAAMEAGMITCVAISAAGARGRGILATGSYDKGVRVLHNVLSSDRDSSDKTHRSSPRKGASPPPVTMRLLGRHKDGVRSVAISADGRWVVSGDREGRMKVWEVPQEAPSAADGPLCRAEAEFEAHKGYVYALCMSPDARTVVSGGSDRAFRVWDLSLIVYARRMVLNRLRALWTAGRLRRARQKRHSSSSRSSVSPKRSGGGKGGKAGVQVLKAFNGSREQRQQILENLFALPEIIYAKVLMYV